MNGVQTRFKCKLDVKRCKRFVFPPSSLLPRSNALKTKAIRYFQTDRTLTRIVSPPLQYNKKGQIIKREETFPLPKDPLPTQVSKQVDVYEYDTYGYLTKITFEKTLVNSDKTSGSLIFLYDEFGNQIDSNAYYEYDSTGRWIQKTDRGDAKNTEKIQIIYQQ